jgi:hypothetical protein
VRRQDRERLGGRVEEQHQEVVERGIFLARPGHPALVPVAQGGFVAVVAVGDRDRARARQAGQRRRRAAPLGVVGQGPQPVSNAVVVPDLDVRRRRRSGREQSLGGSRRVAVQPNDGTRVHTGGPEEAVAIFLRGIERPFVGQHGALTWRLEAEPAEEPELGPFHGGSGHDVGLLVDIDRGPRVLMEGPVRPPGGERPGRPPVALLGILAGLRRRQVEPDDVPGVPSQEPALLVRGDHVVRRAENERQVPHGLGAEAERAKRADVGHGFLGWAAAKGAGTRS